MSMSDQHGFTLIELLMAMAVFGFMLTIIVVGFINVVHIHNTALQSNQAQDSARSAMDVMVQAIRDSTGVASVQTGQAPGPVGNANFDEMCLNDATGVQKLYYVTGSPAQIVRGDTCTTTPTNVSPITSNTEAVSYFKTVQQTTSPQIGFKPEVQISLTLGSANGTTTGTGQALACNNNNADRVFCSTATLTSGAVPR